MAARDPLFDHLPPRWRGVRRAAVGYGGLLLVLLVVRLYAGHVSGRRIAAAQAAARASGAPWTAADLQPPPVLAGDNAADFYRRAFMLIQAAPGGPTETGTVPFPAMRFDPAWQASAAAASAAHGPAFNLAHEAATRKGCDWLSARTLMSGSLINLAFADTTGARRLADEIGDHAMLAHCHCEDLIALSTIGDMLALGRAISLDRTLIGELVAIGIDAVACNRAGAIALDLTPGRRDTVTATRVLMQQLLEAEDWASGSVAAPLEVESVDTRSEVAELFGDDWLMRPLKERLDADIANDDAACVADVRAGRPLSPQPHAARSYFWSWHFAGCTLPLSPLLYPTQAVRDLVSPVGYALYDEAGRRILMELRLTRVRLAVRLFKAEHNRWPASIDELVPTYLPAVPRSAHQPAAARVEFVVLPHARPDGADRPMVYVDLYNGTNDPPDGETTSWTTEQSGQRRADERGRQWRDIDAWPRQAFPSTQPTP